MASPDSTGGGGTHFEARLVAYYLAAALSESPARALPGLYAREVVTQRAAFGEPLDDAVITGVALDGRTTKLSVQAKSSLSFTENDKEWLAVLKQAWSTFLSPAFDAELHRLAVAISSYNARADKYYRSVLTWAAHSPNAVNFFERISRPDFSHKDQRKFVETTRKIIDGIAGEAVDDDAAWRFLKSFQILHFDFDLGDASRDVEGAIDRLRHGLAADQREQAAAIWSGLIAYVGEMTPVGGGATRQLLAAHLATTGLPSPFAGTHWGDVQTLDRESKRALDVIKSDIHGLRLNRAGPYEQVQDALATARFVQIDGEPGSGKSALLRQLAEETAEVGPVFVLKDNRVQPRGWGAHAGQLGVTGDLVDLLSEMGAASEPILFIDGIDKITDPASQLTINDVVRAVATEVSLANWRIVVTVREQNLDHIATWLDPEALRLLPVRSVTVPALGDDELGVIASEFPRLRPLFLEGGNADVILRRPFFLEAILKLAGREGTTALPASEVELLKLWWAHGGADEPGFTPAQHRRNALLSLAERYAATPAQPISIRGIAPEPLDDLKSTGVLRDRLLGHSVSFAHDIYEEWALCEWLIGQLPAIAPALKAVGEPQELVRPVQLVGSFQLETNATEAEWQSLYEDLADPSLRPVWQRAVLTSCLRTTRTKEALTKLSAYLRRDENEGLKKLLNALRTLEVLPNSTFLDETTFPNLDPEERVQFAHATAWPKPLTWVRFFDWFFAESPSPSPELIPDLVPVFSTWQQACAGQNVRHCRRIGGIAHRWLEEFETALHPEQFRDRRDPFGVAFDSDEERGLEAALRTLFLSSAGDVPELVAAYLKARATDRLSHMYRDKILAASASVGRALPAEMVDYIIAACLVHPKSSARAREHSRLNSGELGVEAHQSFYPASPYQPPFLALLRHHEAEGLRLVRAICNHSVDVWRWLRQHPGYHREAVTPLPVDVEFSWGKQTFWGDGQVYTWFRGSWGNHASQCALMALELWAFERIDDGDNFTDVMKKVLEGNECVAALGLAVSLAMAHQDKSVEAALPLITCPHIWQWDLARSVHDQSSMPSNEIGDWSRHRHLLEAVRGLNRRPHRADFIRDMVPYYVFWHDASVKARYTEGIRAFTSNLPFEYEEDRDDADFAAELQKRMGWYVEQADPQYWHSEPTEDGKQIKFWNDPPSANSPEHVRQRTEYEELNRFLRIALWAQKSLDEGVIQPGLTVAEALAEALALDADDLFERPDATYNAGNRKAAVAGAAFAFARFADDGEWSAEGAAWALDTLQRAATSVSSEDHAYRGSMLSMDPLIFAVHGYGAMLARGHEVARCQDALLNLAVDPFEAVNQAVLATASTFAEALPDFYWALFALFVRQSIYEDGQIGSRHAPYWDEPEAAHNMRLLGEAERLLAAGEDVDLTPIPLPWLMLPPELRGDPEAFGYARNDEMFDWHFAEKTILRADIPPLLSSARRREQFLLMVEQLLAMTIQEIVPPFADTRRDNRGNTPFEWVFAFSHWLGKVSGHLTPSEVERIILNPIFGADNETALLMMQSFAPSFLAHTLLPPAEFSDDAFSIWEKIADWIFANPEARQRRHVDREYSLCVFILLFCFSGDFRPLVCVIDEGWKPLQRFVPIVERAIKTFGINSTLYLGVLRFFKRGGLDLMPTPGLEWLGTIAVEKKQDQDFWKSNGDETVEVLKLVLAKRADILTASHRETITLITDILVDGGVRGAGFLQQDQSR